MTTAQYRNQALEHEKNLRWADAAECWKQAIANYPNKANILDAKDSSALKDLMQMEERRHQCCIAWVA